MSITLTINGKLKKVPESMDIAMYLNSLGVKIQFVAVGYNGAVVDKGQYHEIILEEGDVLEIVRPVGGG